MKTAVLVSRVESAAGVRYRVTDRTGVRECPTVLEAAEVGAGLAHRNGGRLTFSPAAAEALGGALVMAPAVL